MPEIDAIQFVLFGVLFNCIGLLILSLSTVLKIQHLSKYEILEYIEFSNCKRDFLDNYCTPTAKIIRKLTFLVPGHLFFLSIIFCYNLIKYRGAHGIIRGYSSMEQISIFPLINYNLKDLDK